MTDRDQETTKRRRFDPHRMGWPLADWGLLTVDDSFRRLVASAYLFWPEFVEVDGCVVLAHRYEPANFAGWMDSTAGDRGRVEAAVNYTYLGDLLMNQTEEANTELDEAPWAADAMAELAEVLASCWRAALLDQFPAREFSVGVDYRKDDLPAIYCCSRPPTR